MRKCLWTLISLSALVVFMQLSCKKQATEPGGGSKLNSATVKIIYTNDEHGWMDASADQDGAASMMGLWRNNEAYTDDASTLILSGGDNWSGPAISTWFRGESMTAVMNAMEYDAAAIGNHEFDFKIEGLEHRFEESTISYLAANILNKTDGQTASFAKAYTIEVNNGVKVGIIGLASVKTPYTTFPAYVEDYYFESYEVTLDAVLPQLEDEDVDMVIILGHLTGAELSALVPYAARKNIPLILGGHSHQRINNCINGVTILQAGSYMKDYGRIDITWDVDADTLIDISSSLKNNKNGIADNTVAAIVDIWRQRTDAELALPIGYADAEIGRRSPEMANLITDSWLVAIPQADVALTNSGGIRQSISQGVITLATIVGVLPFENFIYQLELSGSQLMDFAQGLEPGGLSYTNGWKMADGSAVHPDSMYVVLTTDYIYSSSNSNVANYDTTPYETGIHWRQPVIDWISSLKTDESDPLNNYLDTQSRK
ncbi:bifunctional metallophosphatase/5'-nucleotidase [bacterium]|nr:bifunctional metallophosphatase/5'-nucleotidase [bacterium]